MQNRVSLQSCATSRGPSGHRKLGGACRIGALASECDSEALLHADGERMEAPGRGRHESRARKAGCITKTLAKPRRPLSHQLGRGVVQPMKTVFTTGEAAKICKVSQQTIIRCFDDGKLKGFRVPGSRFRRIPRDQLYAFMRDHGIPTDALDSGRRKLLIVDDDQDLVDLLVDHFERDGRFDVRSVNNGFGAGMMIKEFRPDLVVLDIMLPDINGMEVCQLVRKDESMDDVRIICISGMVEEDRIQKLRDAGADDFMKKPFDVDALTQRVCQLLDVEAAQAG